MIDDWWRRQFRILLDRERSGADPRGLIDRWLVLNRLAFWGERRRITFEIPVAISQFLDDADIRGKDTYYAERQWARAEEWLNG